MHVIRQDIEHLPVKKQRELARVLEILFAEFEEAQALATSAKKKSGRILKIILFGSYDRRCFELLERAYVEARYSEHYRITADELDWLGERVQRLQAVVEETCRERLMALAQ